MCVLWMVTRAQPGVESSFVWFHPVMLFCCFIMVCVCVCVCVRTCASWHPFEIHPGWVLPRSEQSSWPTLCPSSPAPKRSVFQSLLPAPMPAASQVQPGTNIHSHKSIIRTQYQHLSRLPHLCLLSVPTGWQQTETQAYKWVPAGVLTVMTPYLSSEHWALVGQK